MYNDLYVKMITLAVLAYMEVIEHNLNAQVLELVCESLLCPY